MVGVLVAPLLSMHHGWCTGGSIDIMHRGWCTGGSIDIHAPWFGILVARLTSMQRDWYTGGSIDIHAPWFKTHNHISAYMNVLHGHGELSAWHVAASDHRDCRPHTGTIENNNEGSDGKGMRELSQM